MSCRRVSAASIAAPLTPPLRKRIARSHSQLGDKPVAIPSTTSAAIPSSMRVLRGYRSQRAPIRGAMMAKLSMKLLVKTPMLATVAPRLIA